MGSIIICTEEYRMLIRFMQKGGYVWIFLLASLLSCINIVLFHDALRNHQSFSYFSLPFRRNDRYSMPLEPVLSPTVLPVSREESSDRSIVSGYGNEDSKSDEMSSSSSNVLVSGTAPIAFRNDSSVDSEGGFSTSAPSPVPTTVLDGNATWTDVPEESSVVPTTWVPTSVFPSVSSPSSSVESVVTPTPSLEASLPTVVPTTSLPTAQPTASVFPFLSTSSPTLLPTSSPASPSPSPSPSPASPSPSPASPSPASPSPASPSPSPASPSPSPASPSPSPSPSPSQHTSPPSPPSSSPSSSPSPSQHTSPPSPPSSSSPRPKRNTTRTTPIIPCSRIQFYNWRDGKDYRARCAAVQSVLRDSTSFVILQSSQAGGLGHKYLSILASVTYALLLRRQYRIRLPEAFWSSTLSVLQPFRDDAPQRRYFKELASSACYGANPKRTSVLKVLGYRDVKLSDCRVPDEMVERPSQVNLLRRLGVLRGNENMRDLRRVLLRLLLNPTPALQRMIAEFRRSFFTRRYVLAVQIRMGGCLADSQEAVEMMSLGELWRLPHVIRDGMKAWNYGAHNTVVFLSSDSSYAEKYVAKALGDDYTVVTSHFFRRGHTSGKAEIDATRRALIDLFLIADADALVACQGSGYGRIAMMMGRAKHMVLFHVSHSKAIHFNPLTRECANVTLLWGCLFERWFPGKRHLAMKKSSRVCRENTQDSDEHFHVVNAKGILAAEHQASLARRVLVRPGEVHTVGFAEVSIMPAKGEVSVRPVGGTIHIHIGDGGFRIAISELGRRNGVGILQREQEMARIRIVESISAGRNDSNGGIRPEEIVILILNDVDDRSPIIDSRMEGLGRHLIRLSREDAFPLPLVAYPLDKCRRVFFV